jgi:hypothetical protein
MAISLRTWPLLWGIAALLTALAAALALLPAAAHADQHERTAEPPTPRDLSLACPHEDVPDRGFGDVGTPDSGPLELAINCLAWYGITQGVTPDTYGRGLEVRRDQMASFVANLLDHVDVFLEDTLLPEYDGDNRFTDVSDDNVHVASINRLAEVGVVVGGPGGLADDRYGPALVIRRDQMASFLNRVYELVLGQALTSNEVYYDDIAATVHADNINGITEARIAGGLPRAGDRIDYDPATPVFRLAMALFLMRTVDDLIDREVIDSGPQVGLAFLTDVRVGEHEHYDRVVWEFEGPVRPDPTVSPDEPPFSEAATGNEVEVAGETFLRVDIDAADVDLSEAEPRITYDGPDRFQVDGNVVTEVVYLQYHHGMMSWVVGLADDGFDTRTEHLEDPLRFLLDVSVRAN